jgi:hypothetical protein
VKGESLIITKLTGTHVIRNSLFLVDKWDPAKEGTKQLHEINIENKVESLKKIANIANQSLVMSAVIHAKNSSITKISNNDLRWEANFAKLVEYVGKYLKLPSQVDGPTAVTGKQKLGMWYGAERNKSHTTARGDRMLVMKAIVSILYNRSRPRILGSDEKIRVKKIITELKSIA